MKTQIRHKSVGKEHAQCQQERRKDGRQVCRSLHYSGSARTNPGIQHQPVEVVPNKEVNAEAVACKGPQEIKVIDKATGTNWAEKSSRKGIQERGKETRRLNTCMLQTAKSKAEQIQIK